MFDVAQIFFEHLDRKTEFVPEVIEAPLPGAHELDNLLTPGLRHHSSESLSANHWWIGTSPM